MAQADGSRILAKEDRNFSSTFLRMLMTDVLASLEQMQTDDTAAAQRNFVRTLFAAVEGTVWEYREYVRGIAKDVGALTSEIDAALKAETYSVTDTGRIISQPRYLSLAATVRLTTRLAQSVNSEFEVDFGDRGWSALKATIALRNRLTHPKRLDDLEITSDDVSQAWTSLLWLTGIVVEAMSATQRELVRYNADFRALAEDLIAGKPEAWAEYRAALLASDD
jgi:hypothetical protein